MNRLILISAVVMSFSLSVQAKQPKEVVITGPFPLPVDTVEIDSLPPVELAPGQTVDVNEPEVAIGDVVVRQAFANTISGPKLVSFPDDVILKTIIVAPASIDSDPGLVNCKAIVRWPSAAIHPGSNDRIVLNHIWKGTNQIALNYAMPYPLRLPQGQQFEATVSRVGSSGFCEAVLNFTGTVAP